MNHLAVLTARELRAHAPAAGVAAVAALLPWIAPWVPGFSRHPPADVRQATALVVAVLVGAGLAMFVGSGLVARDLAEGRLAFFLTLPVRTTTLWLARLLAGCALVYAALTLVLLPVLGSGRDLRVQQEALLFGLPVPWLGAVVVQGVPLPFLALPVVPLILILLTHQLAVGLRARTPWLLLEILAFGGAVLVGTGAAARLTAGRAASELTLGGGSALLVAILAVVAAGAIGFSSGGVLLARFHRAQAIAAAGGVLVAALGMAAYTGWVLAPGADAVATVEAAEVSPAGGWVAAVVGLKGRPSYVPWALYNGGTGAWLPLGAGRGWGGTWDGNDATVIFTADDRGALWRRPPAGSGHRGQDLVWIDLTGPTPRLVETLLQVPYDGKVALSSDGTRIAVRGADDLAVWSDGGRRLLAAVALPRRGGQGEALCFTPTTLRHARIVAGATGLALEVRELDPVRRRFRVAPTVPLAPGAGGQIGFSPTGERLLLQAGDGSPATLHDGATGALLGEVAPTSAIGGMRRAAFLADGRVIAPVPSAAGLDLRLVGADGELLRTVHLGPGRGTLPVAEWRPGAVLVSVGSPAGWDLREVDFRTGEVRSLGTGLMPPSPGLTLWDPRPLAGPGAPVLLWDGPRRALVSIEPGHGPIRVLPRPSS